MKRARKTMSRRLASNNKPVFINVDLEIESLLKLDSLVAAMGERVMELHSGRMRRTKRNFVSLEISRQYRDPDATIHALCDVIEKLPSAVRRIWAASTKEFDIGYELRPFERSLRFSLRADTLQRIATVGASLAVTYYQGETSQEA
jgi:hypothetical protein